MESRNNYNSRAEQGSPLTCREFHHYIPNTHGRGKTPPLHIGHIGIAFPFFVERCCHDAFGQWLPCVGAALRALAYSARHDASKGCRTHAIAILTLILLFSLPCHAQMRVDDVLAEIEANSLALQAAASEADAQRHSGRAERCLENPEVEFNYLWGKSGIGTRHDISITQGIDFATIAGLKRSHSRSLDEMASLSYEATRTELLLQAKLLCIELIYYDEMISEFGLHLLDASLLCESYEKKMSLGEATVLELNKARLHLASVKGEIARAEAERDAIRAALTAMNGGKELELEGLSYGIEEQLPEDFEGWFAQAAEKNPALAYLRAGAQAAESQVRIDKSSSVPSLTLGYMDEIGKEDKYRGLTLGLSIPLWKNSSRVRASKAEAAAASSRSSEAQTSYYGSLLSLYTRAAGLQSLCESLSKTLSESDNRSFLTTALAEGEISILDYLMEVDLYYDTLSSSLEARRDLRSALAELNAVDL